MKLFKDARSPFKTPKSEQVTMDKTLNKINSILCRKDMVNVENERLDAVRLLAYYLETSGKEMKSKELIKFLKG